MTYVTSDLHFDHGNIIKYSKRPFKNVDEMNEVLIKNWNDTVKKDDTIIIAGDFAYGSKADWKKILLRLNGDKILVVGNHDSKNSIPKECFTEICSSYELKYEDTFFHITHYPMTSWNGMFKDSLHLFGHVHNNTNTWEHPNLPNAINVGVDVNNFNPISIVELIKKKVNFVKTMKENGLLVD